jgi:hypothetical protein
MLEMFSLTATIVMIVILGAIPIHMILTFRRDLREQEDHRRRLSAMYAEAYKKGAMRD